MKVKFLLDYEGHVRGDEAELEESLAADLLCDSEAPAPTSKMDKPVKPGK